MAANPKSPVVPSPGLEQYYHVYHAEAHVLSGNLKHPVDQPIEHHAHAVLKNRRSDHITQTVEETSLEGLISFKSGHTRVSGSKIQKKDMWGKDHSGWVTLSTSVIEGLNVFEVITADRVVAQLSSEHAMKNGHVPKVTFLGTRFENLRVAGYPVQVELDLAICGDKPEGDRPYLEDRDFLDRVQRQMGTIASAKGLPEDLEKQYDAKIAYIDDLKKRANGRGKGNGNGYPKLECSLVKSIGPIPIPGVKTFGNIIFIPDFGTVSLAEIEVGRRPDEDASSIAEAKKGSENGADVSNYFTIRMLNMHLGCIGGGNIQAGSGTVNGKTKP